MKKALLALSAVFILAGCTTTPSRRIEPEIIDISDPKIGVETTRTIGETLVSEGSRIEAYGLEMLSPALDGCVSKGLYRQTESSAEFDRFDPITSTGAAMKTVNNSECFLAYSKRLKSLQRAVYNDFGMIYYLGDIPQANYQYKKFTVDNKSSFQKTLIFTGKDKDILRFTYREFADDYARPAFSVDVVYDLSESKIVQYQKLKMEVLNATSTQITYKLISNF